MQEQLWLDVYAFIEATNDLHPRAVGFLLRLLSHYHTEGPLPLDEKVLAILGRSTHSRRLGAGEYRVIYNFFTSRSDGLHARPQPWLREEAPR